jgi:hypothetical protein
MRPSDDRRSMTARDVWRTATSFLLPTKDGHRNPVVVQQKMQSLNDVLD